MFRMLIASCVLLFAGCAGSSSENNSAAGSGAGWTPPPAGTVVAADSMRIENDSLNDGWFSVRLTAAEGYGGGKGEAFKYKVHARFGKAEADGVIVMPFGGERLKPLLRKGDDYSYIMGFVPGPEYGGDNNFHEYYQIAGIGQYIRITPLKGFQVQ